MLIQRDHEKLVEELYKLRDRYEYEVNVVSMDKLSPFEQSRPAGRTTVCTFYLPIRSGVTVDLIITDYDGRARQWSDVAVVDEALATLDSHRILLCWWFAHDYEYTTRALGMVHYGFWGDRSVSI